jgi:hypothetical protein
MYNKKNIPLFFVILMIILLPVVVNIIQICYTKQNIFNFSLSYYNDELVYFHSGRQIAENGYVTGINGYNDTTSENFNFNGWGAANTLFLGILYRLFGIVTFMTPVYINLLLYLFASVYFAYVAAKEKISIVNILLAVGTFSTVVLYLFSAMMEIVHISFAIIFASSFISLLRGNFQKTNKREEKKIRMVERWLPKLFINITILLMIIAILLRPLWGCILFAYLSLVLNKKLNKVYSLFFSFFISISITAISYLIFKKTSAPYLYDTMSFDMTNALKIIMEACYQIIIGTARYIKNGHIFNFKIFNDLIYKCCIPLSLIISMLLLSIEGIRNLKNEKFIILSICEFVLLSTFFTTIIFYSYEQVFRMVIPFMIFIVLVLTSIYDIKDFIKKYWCYLFSMYGIAIVLFFNNFTIITSGRFNKDKIELFYKQKQEICQIIVDCDAECEYNNTVAIDWENIDINILAFPSWIGLNIVSKLDVENAKSKYFYTKNKKLKEKLMENHWKEIYITEDNGYIMEKYK